MRILIAEDDDRTANYLVRGLTESGHIVDRVADGETALAMALEGIYEALVLDRMLPGMDGLSLMKQLRADGIETPILLLTTMAGIDDRVAGLEAGADDYLVKPFTARELVARIGTHISMSRLRRRTMEMEKSLRSEAERERERLRAALSLEI